jgi:cytochrome c5
LSVLVRHARQGINGMPAGGLCLDCSDADLEQLILFMSSDLSGNAK